MSKSPRRESCRVWLALAVLFGLVAPAGAQETDSQPLVDRFKEAARSGNLAACEATVEEMHACLPPFENVVQFEFEIGRLQQSSKSGDLQKAQTHLEKLLPSGPASTPRSSAAP